MTYGDPSRDTSKILRSGHLFLLLDLHCRHHLILRLYRHPHHSLTHAIGLRMRRRPPTLLFNLESKHHTRFLGDLTLPPPLP